jgi:hypothetical protein
MLTYLENINDYFAGNYFSTNFAKEVKEKAGYDDDTRKAQGKKISALRKAYYEYRTNHQRPGNRRRKDQILETHRWHVKLLEALGYNDIAKSRYTFVNTLSTEGVVPVWKVLKGAANRPQLFVMEMRTLIPREDDTEPDGLFEQQYHRQSWDNIFQMQEGDTLTPSIVNAAVSEVFLLDKQVRPEYILLLAGSTVFLLHYEKWSRGAYLQFDLEALFETGRTNKDDYPTVYALLCRHSLAPDGEIALVDQLNEESHKKAQAVTQDLKEGVILAVELLANAALRHHPAPPTSTAPAAPPPELDAGKLTEDCLNIVYRLLFLFYAESRSELKLLPVDDPDYKRGYSLEMLRDLELVRLQSEEGRHGYFFDDTLKKLFGLLFNGYKGAFTVNRLDSPLFDDKKLHYLSHVRVPNKVWQDIIKKLSLSKKSKQNRGRISYANLDINQLGSVYESLLSYRGIIATEELIEVHIAKNPGKGTWLTPRRRIDDFKFGTEVLKETNPEGYETDQPLVHKVGTFVYRLNGRDREKSASFYTPEVLTRTVVHYTLEAYRDKLMAEEMKARELMQLKILEPAMGAAAFHNEAINQLSELYLEFRQREITERGGKRINPSDFPEQRQRVKAAIAANNVYGVDLNATAVELGKLSLWLNVIHRDMETPFFGHRLGQGNAVVGAWLKAYAREDVVGKNKKWWNKAPRPLDPTRVGLRRKKNEVYHFLLPDASMVAGTKNSTFSNEKYFKTECVAVNNWRKNFCGPVSAAEFDVLLRYSKRIDILLESHYQFRLQIEKCTAGNLDYYGAKDSGEACELNLTNYAEKEELLAKSRNDKAPYGRLKLLMDYWCALWFWDPRDYLALPNRQDWFTDLRDILGADAGAGEGTKSNGGEYIGLLFGEGLFSNDNLNPTTEPPSQASVLEQLDTYTIAGDVAGLSPRLAAVKKSSASNKFFHYQLEFWEVFRERGGFDVAVGNPPWISLGFSDGGITSEFYPEVIIRGFKAPEIKKMVPNLFELSLELKEAYFDELLEGEGLVNFMNGFQNYPLLAGQRNNLYKCIVENGFQWINEEGFLGLLHPEGLYNVSRGERMRKEIYQRLKYHFQFKNELSLFAEVDHHVPYGIHIYEGTDKPIKFISISNLFSPATIGPSLRGESTGSVGGYKTYDEATGKWPWNVKPHSQRVVQITQRELTILANIFENSENWETAKLVNIHAKSIIDIFEKLSQFPTKVSAFSPKTIDCWNETTAVDDGIIKPETRYPDLAQYELIYSGPHFFVGTPFYKTPRAIVKNNSSYDEIDLTRIPADYVPRTNYVPAEDKLTFAGRIKGLKVVSTTPDGGEVYDRWVDYYRFCISRRVSLTGERTLQPCLIPPRVTHVDTVITALFKKESLAVELAGLCSSIVMDFFVRSIGKGDIRYESLKNFPLGISEKYASLLFLLTLRLNCLTRPYADLWSGQWKPAWKQLTWSVVDDRLSPHAQLSKEWTMTTPLRNAWERRQALIEVDVLTAMALGLTLEELVLIYEVQFPEVQKNDMNTWYDASGNIVFTKSRGLTGVGMWKKKDFLLVKDTPPGGEVRYTLEEHRTELYGGQERVFVGPFTRGDRATDYGMAWAFWAEKLA